MTAASRRVSATIVEIAKQDCAVTAPDLSRRSVALLALLAVATVGLRAQGSPVAAPRELDAYVARAMRTFDVPGIALAIVKDGQVVVAKGYGVRKLGDPASVDARTLFGIASNTKVFTATALGLLVEEGKLEWDAPVIRYLPWFQMWDPYVTRELTIRDLLVHRSGLGLGAGDLLWWPPSTYRPQGDRAAPSLHPPGDRLQHRVCVRQRAVSHRRRSDRGAQRPVVGGFRQRPHSQAEWA